MTHPCNNPNLSPIEFLEAVMHDDTFSIALRVKAAKALTLIHTKAPVPPITIHIKDPYSHEYLTRFPWLKEFAAKDPEHINANSQSFSLGATNNRHPRCGDPGRPNIETKNPNLSLDQILELIRTSDLDNLPLCECGHRMFFPCKPVRTN